MLCRQKTPDKLNICVTDSFFYFTGYDAGHVCHFSRRVLQLGVRSQMA